MAETVVDRLFREHEAVAAFLRERGELSFVANFDASFRKMLLMSAASYFESQVRDCVLQFIVERTNSDPLVVAFAKNKAISRQYHTYFEWSSRNASGFFGLFGTGFKTHMAGVVRANEDLSSSIAAFLELGNLRNTLVHEDFASYPLEKTVDEIYDLYRTALPFMTRLPVELRACGGPRDPEPAV